MPQVLDNIEESLLPVLRQTLEVAERADFCIGYFNLRGWRSIDDLVEQWSGGRDACCRVLVGMQPRPDDELRQALSLGADGPLVDNHAGLRMKQELAEKFREQLTIGAPTAKDARACANSNGSRHWHDHWWSVSRKVGCRLHRSCSSRQCAGAERFPPRLARRSSGLSFGNCPSILVGVAASNTEILAVPAHRSWPPNWHSARIVGSVGG